MENPASEKALIKFAASKWSELSAEDKLFIGSSAEEVYEAYVAEYGAKIDVKTRGKLADDIVKMAEERGIPISKIAMQTHIGKILLNLVRGRPVQRRLKNKKPEVQTEPPLEEGFEH